MCCMMQVTTNDARLMDRAMNEWTKDTYHPRGPIVALKDEGVVLNAEPGSATAVFKLDGHGHYTSPESWVAAIKGMVTLYNWGLKLNPPQNADPDFGVIGSAPRWTAEHMGQPCEQRIVGDNGHEIDLSLFCRGGAPMGLGKAESRVMDDHEGRHEDDEPDDAPDDGPDECSCGCNDDCGEETFESYAKADSIGREG